MRDLKFPARRSGGFALLEALVCMALLAAALFLLLKLQAQAVQSGAGGQPGGVAARLAESLAERVIRNRAAARLGAYDLALGSSFVASSACDSVCTASELAQADLMDWQREVAASLPQGRSLVRRVGAAASTLEIWLVWRRATSTGISTNCASDLGLSATEPEQCFLLALPL